MPTYAQLKAVLNPVESVFSIFVQNRAYPGLFLMPPIIRDDYAGQFWKYDLDDAFVTSDLKRAADGTASELEWKPSLDSFTTRERAKRTWMSDRNEDKADEQVRPSRTATFRVMNQILLAIDMDVAAIATSTSLLTQNVTLSLATQKYTDRLNSDPLGDFSTARLTLKLIPYQMMVDNPDARLIAITTPPVIEALRLHPDILGQFINVDGPLSLSNLAQAMGVQEVLVADSLKQGATAGAPAYVWNNDIVFAFVNPSMAEETMSFGFTVMTKMPDTRGLATNVAPGTSMVMGDRTGLGVRMRDYREEKKGGGGTWREGDAAWGQKVVLPQLAYLIKSAV